MQTINIILAVFFFVNVALSIAAIINFVILFFFSTKNPKSNNLYITTIILWIIYLGLNFLLTH